MAARRCAALALCAVGVLLAACTGSNNSPPTPKLTRTTTPAIVHRTGGATSVRSFGATGRGTGDDTAAFAQAEDAALASRVRYSAGPGGRPQAVVYVPPGSYRLLHLAFRSDIRLEVDAGAVLMQAGGRDAGGSGNPPALIDWDGPPGHALSNVSIVGVGTSSGGRKSQADPIFPGWSVVEDFTFDLDPAHTDSNDLVTGIQALNVDGFLIQNVFSIENDSQPSSQPKTDEGWWPQSRKAALGLREQSDTPPDGSVFYDPHNGAVKNWYNVHGPKGFGPNQVNAGHDLSFQHIFSRGGTTLRFETDASQGKSFAAELRGVHASDIAGQNCNRAVAFTPHAQVNYDVHVTGVLADSCADGVLESFSPGGRGGKFVDSSVTDVTVIGGDQAQDGIGGSNGLWRRGRSQQAVTKDGQTRKLWSVTYSGTLHCYGNFSQEPSRIMTASGLEKPRCS